MSNILIAVPSKKEKLPLSITHPELAKQADGWDPTQFTAGSNRRVKWKCALGHKWSACINNVTSYKNRTKPPCPYCLNQRVWVGFNDVETIFPELAIEAHNWDPTTEVFASHKKKQWKCSKGHIWEAAIFSRSGSQKSGCPFCANQKVWPGFNDLATINPELAKEADGWDPTQITSRANKKLKWVCKKGHNWEALLSNRGKGAGCPYCSNQKVLSGFNDLESQYPSIAREAHAWDPSTVVSKSSRKREWICRLGHVYSASPDRRIRGDGCPICSSHQLLKGFNDLATLLPNIAVEAFEWDPSTVMSQSQMSRKWRCTEGHIWKTTPATRAKGSGCPSCAKTGFDPNNDGFLYFLEHDDWNMYQIGITNVPNIRLGKHRKLGWKLLELRGPMDGHLTQQLETAILRMLRAKGADLSNEKIAGKFDGYSEAWSKGKVEVSSIKELMTFTEEHEGEE